MDDRPQKKRRPEAAVRHSPPKKRRRRTSQAATKQHADNKNTRVARMVGTSRLRSRAAQLGADVPIQELKGQRVRSKSLQEHQDTDAMAHRLKTGRTVQMCLRLMAFHVLAPLKSVEEQKQLQPSKGLSAKFLGSWVFIIDVFTRRGIPLADIAHLVQTQDSEHNPLIRLSHTQTVPQSDLQEVGFWFRPINVQKGGVTFEAVEQEAPQVLSSLQEWMGQAAKVAELQRSEPKFSLPVPRYNSNVMQVVPSSAISHTAARPDHVTNPRHDRGEVKFFLDLPLPVPMEVRPYRCRECEKIAPDADSSDRQSYFSPTDQDILAAASQVTPHARIFSTSRSSLICISLHCLLYLFHTFFEELNLRSVRRRLADLYASNLLSMSHRIPSPDHLLWPMTAVPHRGALKELLFGYFNKFVRKRVQALVEWHLGCRHVILFIVF